MSFEYRAKSCPEIGVHGCEDWFRDLDDNAPELLVFRPESERDANRLGVIGRGSERRKELWRRSLRPVCPRPWRFQLARKQYDGMRRLRATVQP